MAHRLHGYEAMRWVLLATALMSACGPSNDGTDDAGHGDDVHGSSTGSTDDPDELAGIAIEGASHGHECIDGCETFYSTDFVSVTLVADEDRAVRVELHDWTIQQRELRFQPELALEAEVELEAGEAQRVVFTDWREGFCTMQEWNEPLRVLLVIDDVRVEVEGFSQASYGWDC